MMSESAAAVTSRMVGPVRPPILDVIATYRAGRADFPLARLDDRRLSWALESGLGPLLARTCHDDPQATSLPAWDDLRASDLAARVENGDQADATVDLIRACGPRVGRLTLLKGIWLGHSLYPEPHLRPMRDVDVLVEPERVAEVERVMLELGYRPAGSADGPDYREHHHTVPYRHSRSGVWLEVHRGLVSPRGPYGRDPLFRGDHVREQLRDAEFQGEPVRCLSNELQLAYLAAHWAGSPEVIGGAGAQLVLIDILGLAPVVDWEAVVRGLDGQSVASAIVLLVSYLETRGLLTLEARVRAALWRSQRSFGTVSLAFLRELMDRRLLDGGDYGRWVRSRRNLEITWSGLLRPRSGWVNLLALPWSLVAERWRDRHPR